MSEEEEVVVVAAAEEETAPATCAATPDEGGERGQRFHGYRDCLALAFSMKPRRVRRFRQMQGREWKMEDGRWKCDE